MAPRVCVFEDDRVHLLHPLTLLRPVYDLRCGITSLLEKFCRIVPGADVVLHCRGMLVDTVRQDHPASSVNDLAGTDWIFWNGRAVADPTLLRTLTKAKSDLVLRSGRTVIGARVKEGRAERIRAAKPEVFSPELFDGIATEEVHADLISYPWDVIRLNGALIASDHRSLFVKKRTAAKAPRGTWLIGPRQIVISRTAVLAPGVVLDASNGPVVIGDHARLMPHATVIGPVAIGAGTLVKTGAQIYGPTTIGPHCKVGGEVEAVVMQGYANKQHAGFLGHAWLGHWVNLGADTNNSDLKNNYSTVRMTVAGESIDSGMQFLGLMMGDHSKSAINTMFNTGTVVGISSNVFGADFLPKTVPSFAWGGSAGMTEYNVDKAIQVARKVMQRRDVTMTEADERLLRNVFDLTRPDRMRDAGTSHHSSVD